MKLATFYSLLINALISTLLNKYICLQKIGCRALMQLLLAPYNGRAKYKNTYINKVIAMDAEPQNNLPKQDCTKIYSYFTDPNIAALLIQQISQINEDKELADIFQLAITVEELHLYIYISKANHIKSDTTDSEAEHSQVKGTKDTGYTIRITKKFPVAGVRIYPLKNRFQPRIFDSRDLVYEILGDIWTYKNRIIQLVRGLEKFQEKLAQRNEKYLSMQKTGQFQMGDIFTYQELNKFSTLGTFIDRSKEDGAVIATTQTHLLTFKCLPQGTVSKKSKVYQVTRACDLQCIHQVHHNRLQNDIIITLYKYRSIKNFNEYQKICRQYKFQNSELFIRNILKYVTKFQKIEINLETGLSWKNQQGFVAVYTRMNQCKELESQLVKHQNPEGTFSKLGNHYQKLIQYFSARASCYYLIYVNKLNNLYASQN